MTEFRSHRMTANQHLDTQQAVYLTGCLLADGWHVWAFLVLYVAVVVEKVLHRRKARR